ncbi:MAG: hypothetical protein Q7T76_18595 [Ferruginibacter sp.]|nr:hypothetical protein [Ferruginibacter sp.]
MQERQSMDQVLNDLKQKGYTHSFFKKNNFIYCKDPELNFHTHELQIEEVYRGHVTGSVLNGSVLYKVESLALGIKGHLLNHF